MRPVAPAALSSLLHTLLHRFRAVLLTGGGAIVCFSLLHASASILSDVGADCVEDLVDGKVGRIGRWVLLAAFLIVCARRRKLWGTERPKGPGSPRRVEAQRRAARFEVNRFDVARFGRQRNAAIRRCARTRRGRMRLT